MPTDKQLVAKSQLWEPAKVFAMLKRKKNLINREQVKAVIKKTRSRDIIYGVLQRLGYKTVEITLTAKQKKRVEEVFSAIKNDPEYSRQGL